MCLNILRESRVRMADNLLVNSTPPDVRWTRPLGDIELWPVVDVGDAAMASPLFPPRTHPSSNCSSNCSSTSSSTSDAVARTPSALHLDMLKWTLEVAPYTQHLAGPHLAGAPPADQLVRPHPVRARAPSPTFGRAEGRIPVDPEADDEVARIIFRSPG